MYTDLTSNDRLIFDKCVALAATLGEITIKTLQREFCLVHDCAARMLSTMQNEGIIDPAANEYGPHKYIGKL